MRHPPFLGAPAGGKHPVKIEDHRAKAHSIERSLAQCTAADFETVIEAAMLAGTHWFNILLHRTNVMPCDRDAMHAEFLSPEMRRKVQEVAPRALHAMDEIERLRTPYVRGDMPDGERAATHALACLARLKEQALTPECT